MLTSSTVPDDTIRIMLATDNHIGYMERDPVRGQDSINTFREILQLAVKHDVRLTSFLLPLDSNAPRWTLFFLLEIYSTKTSPRGIVCTRPLHFCANILSATSLCKWNCSAIQMRAKQTVSRASICLFFRTTKCTGWANFGSLHYGPEKSVMQVILERISIKLEPC